MVSQSRNYAKWHVYQERGYETFPRDRNPDRIAASLLALLERDDEEYDRAFETLHQQLLSYHDDVDRPLAIEDAVPDPEAVLYMQDLFVDTDLADIRGLHRTVADRINEAAIDTLGELVNQNLVGRFEEVEDVVEHVGTTGKQADLDIGEFAFEEVSELYYAYYPGTNELRTVGRDARLDRDPDTTIQLSTGDPGPLPGFRTFLANHLLCQIRDCFIGMGVDPPLTYRVLGLGLHHFTLKYMNFDMYPVYVDPDADIEGYVSWLSAM